MKRTYAVLWTWGHREDVPTKKVGTEKLKAWKAEYEAKGWTVRTSRGIDPGYVAYAPDYEPIRYSEIGPDSKLHVCLLYTYDAETKKRVYPKSPAPNDPYSGIGFQRPKSDVPKRRRSGAPRVPIGA